jgi:transposase
MEERSIRYVGIDLAKKTFEARIEYPDSPKSERFGGKTDESGIERLIAKLQPGDRIGLECGTMSFHLAKRLIARVGCEVYVLNAGQLAVIYKSTKKTDLEDAGKIAWIMKRFPPEELPVVSLPTEREEHRRALVSELNSKKKQRNILINRLHSIYAREGITNLSKRDLKTEEVRKAQETLLEGYTLAEAIRIGEELTLFEKHIKAIRREINEDLKTEPLTPYLLSIPGVGPATAMAFLAYVGDGSRFAHGRQVSHFVGITPRVDNSGETVRLGNITKRGCKAIRSIIVQSAWGAVHAKKGNRFQEKYMDLVPRRGKGRAIVAVARRMLEIMWIVATRKEFYNQTSKADLDRKLLQLGLNKKERKVMEPAA